MPIMIPNGLPAAKTLAAENIFVMNETRAVTQDIRPLQILVLNLMPTKIATETQLSRLLGNTPLQVDVELLHMASHVSRNTSSYHLNTFYKTFNDVKDQRFDGLIITGAPVEQMEFEQVDYWEELCTILEGQFATMTVDGLTGTGMHWDENGMISKAPAAVVIENGVYVPMA